MLSCTIKESSKGYADVCAECTRRITCLVEKRDARRKSNGFLQGVKARLAANEARAAEARKEPDRVHYLADER